MPSANEASNNDPAGSSNNEGITNKDAAAAPSNEATANEAAPSAHETNHNEAADEATNSVSGLVPPSNNEAADNGATYNETAPSDRIKFYNIIPQQRQNCTAQQQQQPTSIGPYTP